MRTASAGESFAGASLAVGEDRPVVALQRTYDHLCRSLLENSLLPRLRVEDVREAEVELLLAIIDVTGRFLTGDIELNAVFIADDL